MGTIIGIDLGTTNSCAAVVEGGKPTVIPNREGGRTTPSVVGFSPEWERLVGNAARRQAAIHPELTVSSIKRKMGSGETVRLGSRDFHPQEISAMILAHLKQDAEDFLGQPVTQAVITVPAYFNDAQRQATRDAGRIAGLEVCRIINEPTAAALAYGLDNENEQKVLVYDLGGGTFDVSIIQIDHGVIQVLSTCGDNHLGGDDFDARIADHLTAQFRQQTGIDLKRDPSAMRRIYEVAEEAKKQLSSAQVADVRLPFLTTRKGEPVHLETTLTRAELESMTSDLIERTTQPVLSALRDARLDASSLTRVLLVGGSTRMPAVQRKVRALTGLEPSKALNPDECVALGAAAQGGKLAGALVVSDSGQQERFGKDLLLMDVTPMTLSIETVGGVATHLIERNTPIPTRVSQIFTTASLLQRSVEIKVLQGERPRSRDNKLLGTFRLSGVKRLGGRPQIEVTFDIDVNGIVQVSAKDLATGKQQSITIQDSTNLSPEAIEQARRDAAQYAVFEKQRKANLTLLHEAESLQNDVKHALKGDSGKNLDRAIRHRIQESSRVLHNLTRKANPNTGEVAYESIQQAVQQLRTDAAPLLNQTL
ncbi:MAG: molecular chaperone DnaK [Eubacteriales bacterium]|nr:molecular chaperone DnaK [Eubacteriales bacterium]